MKPWKRTKLTMDKYNQYILAWRVRKMSMSPWMIKLVEADYNNFMAGELTRSKRPQSYQGLSGLLGVKDGQ